MELTNNSVNEETNGLINDILQEIGNEIKRRNDLVSKFNKATRGLPKWMIIRFLILFFSKKREGIKLIGIAIKESHERQSQHEAHLQEISKRHPIVD